MHMFVNAVIKQLDLDCTQTGCCTKCIGSLSPEFSAVFHGFGWYGSPYVTIIISFIHIIFILYSYSFPQFMDCFKSIHSEKN